MAKIFISYRREGGSGFSGRLADDLGRRFGAGEVFRDVEDIASGDDFVSRLDGALRGCLVLLAVIDKTWLSAANMQGRRLDDPGDFVRREIAAALKNGVRVIPVLVEGAGMPSEQDLPDNLKPLAWRQAHELSDSRWEYDVGKLADEIAKAFGSDAGSDKRAPRGLRALIAIAAAGLIVFASAVAWHVFSRPPDLNGSWDLSDGNQWIIRQSGYDLEIDAVHYDTREVWQSGRGAIRGSTITFHLDLVFQKGHSIEGQLTIGSDSKLLTGEALGFPRGNRATLRLRRR
jgi:TIR domain